MGVHRLFVKLFLRLALKKCIEEDLILGDNACDRLPKCNLDDTKIYIIFLSF